MLYSLMYVFCIAFGLCAVFLFFMSSLPTLPCWVDEGLSRLRARSGGLTAAEMAEVAQDDLADVLRHVHWNKVDEGLSRLRARSGGLTAAEMAEVAQDDLADVLRHVHWNKAKAKHIRESAGIIVRRHRGVVPRRRAELLALPGVGPALVEILLNVFDSWDEDDKASAAAAAAAAASSPEAGAVAGGGDRGGDVDGVEGDGGGGGCDGSDGVGDGSSGGDGSDSVGDGSSGGDGSRLGVGGEGADDDDETRGERIRLPRGGGMQTESGRQLVDLTGGVDGDSTDRDGGDDKGPSHRERTKDEEPTTQRKGIEDQDGENGKRGADQGVPGP
ncbi:unnamed protein product [Ectocarpus sp. CCAP 1310/34]|nr:unnamed protein product [Ectocarpus sp. CCAP 1310/34]